MVREAAAMGVAEDAARTWSEEVASRLSGNNARERAEAFSSRAPASYRDLTPPAQAALDLEQMEQMEEMEALAAPRVAEDAPGQDGILPATAGKPGPLGARYRLVVRPSNDASCTFRLRRYGEDAAPLSSLLPLLESFGLVVVEAVPLRLGPGPSGLAVHIDDIGVRTPAPHGEEALRFVPEVHGDRLVDALGAASRGDADVDRLNELVTIAALNWRQVAVLRAYERYRLQLGEPDGSVGLAQPLVDFPDLARALIGYFEARFDPDPNHSGRPNRAEAEARERARCLAQLDLVGGFKHDRALRGYLSLVDATLRTNYFARHTRALALKLDSTLVPHLSKPKPKLEVFVHGPAIEAIHIRAGLIARGGIRWSERPGDFRTEALDLAMAQVKKNAPIVPTGAKGAFVCRGWLDGPSGPTVEGVREAYSIFMSALFDVTDNLEAGQVVHPERVLALDGEDPYLVVAADKGTSSFADLANSISEGRGFWLGDAFASGGSHGYDHKRTGITARGAWVAVRRHFFQLGIDVQREPVSVVGVGDMSGDVFGNGMLQSSSIRLVAAFDHRHVFLDPDPDPKTSYSERVRLAGMSGGSSWDDYDRALVSAGGGIWSRDSKSIPLSPAARRALGVDEAELSPPELVKAILSAPVDLLWFGGIGTFVRDVNESDASVGDHDNDEVRLTADEVRARVIGEGANLGMTQRARIRYSRRGGRVNADFVDNAAGVAISDREVNLKIMLALAIERGRMEPSLRDEHLRRSEPEVIEGVLRQVEHSVATLDRGVPASARELEAFSDLIRHLEASGHLDRLSECLPDDQELEVRRHAGAGLIRPELAVVMAYTKSDLAAAIERSSLAADQALLDAVLPYFPLRVREELGDLVRDHRLYSQLVATNVAGELVDRMGTAWAHETSVELGRDLAEVASAFWAARQVVGAGELWDELDTIEGRGSTNTGGGVESADVEAAWHGMVVDAVAALTRCYLEDDGLGNLAKTIADDRMIAAGLAGEAIDGTAASTDGEPSSRFSTALIKAQAANVRLVAQETGCTSTEAAAAIAGVAESAGIDMLVKQVDSVLHQAPPPGRLAVWHARALIDESRKWCRRAATAALLARGAGPKVATPKDAVEAWVERHRNELERAGQLLRLGAGGEALAAAALALQHLELAI